jgi:putative ABC transport system permease protein
VLKNHLKITLRIIRRQFLYSSINVFGLAIGIACCIFILLYVRNELSFDRYHKDHNRIFRVCLDMKSSSSSTKYACNVPPLAHELKKKIPEVEEAARIGGFYYIQLVRRGDVAFYENGFMYVDPEIFSILTIPFKEGNPQTALRAPNTVVFPERLAQKYFPDEQALGKTIRIGNRDCLITGVVADALTNTHMPYDIFLPISDDAPWMKDWTWPGVLTYVKLAAHADSGLVEQKLRHFGDEHYRNNPKAGGKIFSHFLQPITDIYLHSKDMENDIGRRGSAAYLYIFLTIGLVILLISCINFTNLTTARSANRAREVGVRKVAGAKKNELVQQFLVESGIMALLAMLIALCIVDICLPFINALIGTSLRHDLFIGPDIFVGLLVLTIVVAVLAGGYPAFFLSSFQPISALKGNERGGTSGKTLRKMLVIAQFAVSVVLSVGAIIIYQQLHFMQNKDLGFQKEQKVVLQVKGEVTVGLDWETLKSDFLKHAGISGATASTNFPGEGVKMMLREMTRLVGEKEAKNQMMYFYWCDPDFLKIYGIELAAGRGFAIDRGVDVTSTCLINETAVRAFGWSSPQKAIGKRILTSEGKAKEVIGVVKNFHFRGVDYLIKPLILENNPGMFEHLTLNLNTADIGEALDFIKGIWQQRFPGYPLQYHFLDSVFAKLYQAEERAKQLVTIFTGLGLFIASLGLLGLASYTAQKRTKEIGIRKVLGAPVIRIVLLLIRDFVKWVSIGAIVACPIAYTISRNWLRTFPYRISIGWWPFSASIILALTIAVITVSYHAFRAARNNPIDSLKYE